VTDTYEAQAMEFLYQKQGVSPPPAIPTHVTDLTVYRLIHLCRGCSHQDKDQRWGLEQGKGGGLYVTRKGVEL